MKATESAIRQQLRIKKVREMKNPTILMNRNDFNEFANDLESQCQNFKVGKLPRYEGLPIKTSNIAQKGIVIIYDDISVI